MDMLSRVAEKTEYIGIVVVCDHENVKFER